jgi:hypothetical protein
MRMSVGVVARVQPVISESDGIFAGLATLAGVSGPCPSRAMVADHRDDNQKQGEPTYSTEDDPPPVSLSPSRFGIAQAARSSSRGP